MNPTAQEAHAQELAEIESLSAEGVALLARVSVALQEAAGPDLVRYVEIRKRITAVMADASRRGFPIPAAAEAARKARAELDRTLALTLAPIRKMLN